MQTLSPMRGLDDGECPDVAVAAERRVAGDFRPVAYSFLARFVGGIEFEQFGERGVGVCHPYERRPDGVPGFEFPVHDYHGRLRVVQVVFVFRVGEERQRSRASLFYLGECRNDGIRIPFDLAAEVGGNHACGKFHIVLKVIFDVYVVRHQSRRVAAEGDELPDDAR